MGSTWDGLPLDELRLIAELELRRNTSITVYAMVDGRERRRPADPMARFSAVVDSMRDAMERLDVPFHDASQRFATALQAAQR